MVRRVFLRSPRLRTTGLTVLLSCAAACLIFTTAAQNPAATGVDSIRADELRQKLTYIASEKFKGRGNGTPELNLAADYIAGVFQKNGIKPAAGSGDRGSPHGCRADAVGAAIDSQTCPRKTVGVASGAQAL